MSRLSQQKDKQATKRLIIALVLIVAGIYFLFTYGFKLLISGTLFINQLANKNLQRETPRTSQVLSSIAIDPIPSATNSATIAYSGTALNFDMLEQYLNGEKIDDITISDVFTGELKGLEPGPNTIYFIAKSTVTKETKKTQTFEVTLKTSKPKLEISKPGSSEKVSKDEVTIEGETDKATSIRINSLPVIVDLNGKFSYPYRLKEGENKITVLAEDEVGNTEQKELTVTYSKE